MEILFDPARLKDEIENLEKKSQSPDFWNDSDAAQKTMADLALKKDDLEDYNKLKDGIADNIDMLDLVELSEDSELKTIEEVEISLKKLDKLAQAMKLKTQLSGEYDKNNAYLSINAGAGGLEATDWADMLFRMYTRYFDDRGFKYEIKDLNNACNFGQLLCIVVYQMIGIYDGNFVGLCAKGRLCF